MRNLSSDVLTRWRRRFTALPITARIGLVVVLVYAAAAVLAPFVAPYGEAEIVGSAYQPPGAEFWLGTDQIGRDVLSRLIFAARNTIGIALLTTILSCSLGVSLGIFSTLAGGWVDRITVLINDAIMSVPTLIFALMLLAVYGKNVVSLIFILAVLDSTRFFRLARAASMNVVVTDHVEIALLRGESRFWVSRREILPCIRAPLVAEFGLRFCFVFLTISSLSFLGVGLQPPTADWGSMVAESKTLISYGYSTPLFPAAAIACLAIAINFLMDAYTARK